MTSLLPLRRWLLQRSIRVLESGGSARGTPLLEYMKKRGVDVPDVAEIRRRLMERGAAGVSFGWGHRTTCLALHGCAQGPLQHSTVGLGLADMSAIRYSNSNHVTCCPLWLHPMH